MRTGYPEGYPTDCPSEREASNAGCKSSSGEKSMNEVLQNDSLLEHQTKARAVSICYLG